MASIGDEYEVFIEASVRGYHEYYKDAEVVIGEMFTCERELDNEHGRHAIVIKKEDGKIVGHVPKELSKIFTRFLRHHGELEAECIGCRFNMGKGKGLEFPVDFKLIGNEVYLHKLVDHIKREIRSPLNISDIKKCQPK